MDLTRDRKSWKHLVQPHHRLMADDRERERERERERRRSLVSDCWTAVEM